MTITKEDIGNAIYDRFIGPTEKERPEYIGVECELPMMNREKKPVDFQMVHEMTAAFAEQFGFSRLKYDDEGQICAAADPETGDDLSFDCSYNTLEFSFGKALELNALEERFRRYYTFVSDYLEKRGHAITGMGINPYYPYNDMTPVPNGRYRMLLHHLQSYENYQGELLFHDMPYYGLIACSNQTHLNAKRSCLPEAICTFNRLEPLKALVFANSPLNDYLCVRDHFWRESMHGLNPHNVDSWDVEVRSIEDIIAYIRSMSLYCVERDGKYINFRPTPLDTYFARDTMEGEYFDGETYQTIRWKPALSDLEYLRSFKFVDLTFRGTLELRSACTQPVSEEFSVPAFNLGLGQDIPALRDALEEMPVFHQGYTTKELRGFFVKKNLPAFADRQGLRDGWKKLLELAEKGLVSRGFGEERFLAPLWDRADRLLSPAREMTEGMASGKTLEYYIEKFGKLEA